MTVPSSPHHLRKPHMIPLNPIYHEMRTVDITDLLKDCVFVRNLQFLTQTSSKNGICKCDVFGKYLFMYSLYSFWANYELVASII